MKAYLLVVLLGILSIGFATSEDGGQSEPIPRNNQDGCILISKNPDIDYKKFKIETDLALKDASREEAMNITTLVKVVEVIEKECDSEPSPKSFTLSTMIIDQGVKDIVDAIQASGRRPWYVILVCAVINCIFDWFFDF